MNDLKRTLTAVAAIAGALLMLRVGAAQAQIIWDLDRATGEVARFLQMALAASLLIGSVALGSWIMHHIEAHRGVRRITSHAARRLMGLPPSKDGRGAGPGS